MPMKLFKGTITPVIQDDIIKEDIHAKFLPQLKKLMMIYHVDRVVFEVTNHTDIHVKEHYGN